MPLAPFSKHGEPGEIPNHNSHTHHRCCQPAHARIQTAATQRHTPQLPQAESCSRDVQPQVHGLMAGGVSMARCPLQAEGLDGAPA